MKTWNLPRTNFLQLRHRTLPSDWCIVNEVGWLLWLLRLQLCKRCRLGWEANKRLLRVAYSATWGGLAALSDDLFALSQRKENCDDCARLYAMWDWRCPLCVYFRHCYRCATSYCLDLHCIAGLVTICMLDWGYFCEFMTFTNSKRCMVRKPDWTTVVTWVSFLKWLDLKGYCKIVTLVTITALIYTITCIIWTVLTGIRNTFCNGTVKIHLCSNSRHLRRTHWTTGLNG